jgi:hypothetical protein
MKRMPKLDRDGQLVNTLLRELYPDIRVARVTIPTFSLDEVETEQVKDAMSSFTVDGVEYRLIGAGSSAKEGTFYAVDAAHEAQLAKRFANWPQAAITYFGILVSDCRTLITEDRARVLIVEDLEFGTNDCRGWLSERLFRKLDLPPHRFYQFRLAIAGIQAKGCFKVMDDAVAEAAGADIILPKSSTKPKLDLSLADTTRWRIRLWNPSFHGRLFQGALILGIRDYSRRGMKFRSSYTNIQHASPESLEKEIIPSAREEVQQVIKSAQEGDYSLLLEAIGSSASQQDVIDNEQSEFTSFETSYAEALLKADRSGWSLRMPYVQGRLQRLLARWTFKACSAGAFRFPAFALMDDGVLFLHHDTLHAAADWIPMDAAVGELASDRGLEVRFPIRKKADLLPFRRLSRSEALAGLTTHFTKAGIDSQALADVIGRQLCLEGTFVMHSQKAAENGGDFDFDNVCVIEGNRFPLFVKSREEMTVQALTKNKKPRPKGPWWNLAEEAMKAKGNLIGWITDMTTAALAAGRHDLAEDLAQQLQNALDSLKHEVEVNFKRLREIQKLLPRLPWLGFKRAERISEMPPRVDMVGPNDIVGQLYNAIRPDIQHLFANVAPLHEFAGLMRGGSFTREMHDECQRKAEEFRALCKQNRERSEAVQAALEQAKREFDRVRDFFKQKTELGFEDRAQQRATGRRLDRAKAAVKAEEERSKTELRNFYIAVQIWAKSKKDNRRGWAKALCSIVFQSKHPKATGALVFQAFPQEILDVIVERTGGQPVRVQMPDLPEGEIRYNEEGEVFLVESYTAPDGSRQEKLTFLFRIHQGQIWMDRTQVGTVQSFGLRAGTGEIRNGEVVFTDIPQRPTLRRGTVLRTPEDRAKFLQRCVDKYGEEFVVFVEHDPQSRRVIRSVEDLQQFLDSAPERPWSHAALESVET